MVMYSPPISDRHSSSRAGLSLLQNVLHLLTDDELHAVQAHIAQELRMRPCASASGAYARVAQREGSPCATV